MRGEARNHHSTRIQSPQQAQSLPMRSISSCPAPSPSSTRRVLQRYFLLQIYSPLRLDLYWMRFTSLHFTATEAFSLSNFPPESPPRFSPPAPRLSSFLEKKTPDLKKRNVTQKFGMVWQYLTVSVLLVRCLGMKVFGITTLKARTSRG